MKSYWALSWLAGASLGCASAPAPKVAEPAVATPTLCASWVSASFDDVEPDPCVSRDRFTPEQNRAVQHAMSSVTDTMGMAPPVCPADLTHPEQWKETLAEWVRAKSDRVVGTQHELEQLASFEIGFVVGAGSLAALYEHFALQALAAPRPNVIEGQDGVAAYRATLMQLFGPWTEKAREAYQACAKHAVEADVGSWAAFCRSRQEKLEARINLARPRDRCPDRDL